MHRIWQRSKRCCRARRLSADAREVWVCANRPYEPSIPMVRRSRLMKKVMNLVLEEEDLVELMRILIDEDENGALLFLKQHLKGKARELLEGG